MAILCPKITKMWNLTIIVIVFFHFYEGTKAKHVWHICNECINNAFASVQKNTTHTFTHTCLGVHAHTHMHAY